MSSGDVVQAHTREELMRRQVRASPVPVQPRDDSLNGVLKKAGNPGFPILPRRDSRLGDTRHDNDAGH